jgi:hypothetical protein
MKQGNLIEPCCCERQLPIIINEGRGAAMAVSYGDITMAKLYASVAYLSGSRVVTIVSPKITAELLKPVKTWMQRGWTERLQLLCQDAEGALAAARTVLGDSIADNADIVTIAKDDQMTGQQALILDGDKGVTCITGPLLSRTQAGLCLYSVSVRQEPDAVVGAIYSRVRSRTVEMRNENEEMNNDITTDNDELDKRLAPEAQGAAGAETEE